MPDNLYEHNKTITPIIEITGATFCSSLIIRILTSFEYNERMKRTPAMLVMTAVVNTSVHGSEVLPKGTVSPLEKLYMKRFL